MSTSSASSVSGTSRDVAVFVGSLRRDSITRKVARALPELSPPSLALEIVEIGNIPFFNQDLEDEPPAPWVALRDRVRRADAVLFLTPEYNRSVPAVLKNAIDVASRPYGSNTWDGKPGGVISVSPGAMGGFGANHHLRQSLVFLNVAPLQQPEAYISMPPDGFDASGKLQNQQIRELLTSYMAAFAAWIERIRA